MTTRSAALALVISVVGLGVAGAEPAQQSVAEQPPEIEAKCWFNPQPVRLYDKPRLIALEFLAVRSKDAEELQEVISAAHAKYKDRGLLVVTLTADSCEEAQKFIRAKSVEHKVGAESISAKKFGFDALPGIVLMDPNGLRIITSWSGKMVKPKLVARVVRELLESPDGVIPIDTVSRVDREPYLEELAAGGESLGSVTDEVLALPGEIPPEALSALDEFYHSNLPEDLAEDSGITRGQMVARISMLGSDPEVGYGRLFASGRLSEAAKSAVRERVLEIAETDPTPSVRMSAFFALRSPIGVPGDNSLLGALRRLQDKEPDPFARAAIKDALEKLDPALAATREDLTARPIALNLRRMLSQSTDPASSRWADAHSYKQSVAKRTMEQLLEDYASFADPPDDEIGRQNATLKRDAAMDEVYTRIQRGEVRDARAMKTVLATAMSNDPDPFIRKHVVWSALRKLASGGDAAIRAEIVDLFEKRLPIETHKNVQSVLEAAITELKAKP